MAEHGAVRVSDAEREEVARRLLTAHGEGRLTLVEYDERVRAAHAAVVRDDLVPLLTDLPAGAVPPARVPVQRPAPTRRPDGLRAFAPVPPGVPALPAFPGPCGSGRGAVAAWATVSAVNVLIWLAVSLGSAAVVYPWWIWVAGPWGVALALGGVGRAVARPRT
ncbi:DUF1707 SHOCT-like domain-containing protein [Actinomycetospora soli]|uniref:DUF1707 SHOCT-like domain-containing protein n=1 Tax=Actinomycetospora soli TaxID=2893887 RepID=UPI001E5A198C|nr:DUF1707 domain-containing protein [Actinomycetospora soli]MCD2189446.1 DUF1707 domain-containing protein [Actinomycetospora soli]